jgi:hypothetical protein
MRFEQFASNGQYGVMVTASGAGCSTWRRRDATRWRRRHPRKEGEEAALAASGVRPENPVGGLEE